MMRTAATNAWRACVWALLLGCLACFVFISFARPTEWFRTSQGVKDAQTAMNIPFPGDVPIATTVVLRNGKNTTVNVGRDVALMSGGTTFPIVLQWGSLLLAGLCTTALLPGWRSTRPHDAAPLPDGTIQGFAATILHQVRRIATHPLPPRRFWSWFCGGLNAIELLVFATWLGYAVVYVYYNIDKDIKNVGANLTPPPPLPGRPAPPSSSGTGVPANLALPAMFLVRRLDACGKATGEALRGLVMVMFIPVSRSSFLKWLFGADFSYLIKFHRWMSWGTLIVTTLHGLLYMIQWGAAGDLDYEFQWQPNHRNVTGLIAGVAGLAIALTSTTWMRANYYRVFINVHIIGFIMFVMFSMMHYKALVNWIVPGLLLYGLDRAFRFWQLASNWALVQPSDLTADGSVVTLRLRWTSGARVLPGQTLYLRVPRLSWLQSHPFSVAGVEEVATADPNTPPACQVTLHMKVSGSWLKGLCGLAWAAQPVWVQVEGPYDTCLAPAPAGPVVVMIAGGIGITPLLGLLRHYLAHPGSRPRTTYLLWSCRALCELRILGSDLLEAASPLADSTGTKSAKSCESAGMPEVSIMTNPVTIPVQRAQTAPPTSPHSGSACSWLRTCLHYTGFEADADSSFTDPKTATLKAAPAADSCADATDAASLSSKPSSTAADPSAVTVAITAVAGIDGSAPDITARASGLQLLNPHPLASPALYAACLTLSVFGAFAGLIAASYNDAYQSRISAQGLFYPVAGVSQWFLVALGMVVPPIALLAALAGLRRVAPLHPCLRVLGCIPAGHVMGGALFKDSDAEAGDTNEVNKLTQGNKGRRALEMASQLQAGALQSAKGVEGVEGVGGVGGMGPDQNLALAVHALGPCGAGDAMGKGKSPLKVGGSGKGLQLRRGRPDVAGLLRRVRAAHAGECSEVEVLVGGPPAMWDAVQEACVTVGAEEEPGPALRARRVAHQH